MSIPKIIHYCWFGGNPLPESAIKCINSWKEFCSDYEIIEWNERNFDINMNGYTRMCYEQKKFAFLSDYVRLLVIYQNGGLYFDTDVELIKNPDYLLENKAFFGFENDNYVATGLGFGAEPKNKVVNQMIKEYDKLIDGNHGTVVCPKLNTTALLKFGLVLDGSLQNIEGNMIYPPDYFCPKDYYTERIKLTENTIAIHHFTKSWCEKESIWKRYLRMHPKFNSFVHIPNKIGAKLLGKHYQNLKRHLKGEN